MHAQYGAKTGKVPVLIELEVLWRGKRKYINRKLRSFQVVTEAQKSVVMSILRSVRVESALQTDGQCCCVHFPV